MDLGKVVWGGWWKPSECISKIKTENLEKDIQHADIVTRNPKTINLAIMRAFQLLGFLYWFSQATLVMHLNWGCFWPTKPAERINWHRLMFYICVKSERRPLPAEWRGRRRPSWCQRTATLPPRQKVYTLRSALRPLPTVILCCWPNTIPVRLQTSVQEPRAENCVVSGCYNGLRCVCVAYSVSSATDGDYRDPCAHVEGPGDQERPRVPCIIIGDYASSALRASSQTSIRTSCIQLMDSIPMSIHDNGLRKNMCLLSENNFKSQTSPLFHVWLSRQ